MTFSQSQEHAALLFKKLVELLKLSDTFFNNTI